MKEKIIEIILSACAAGEEYADENTPLYDLSLDSLSFVAVIDMLENKFGIEFEIDEWDFDKWKTVKDIISAVEEKVNEKA